MACLAFGRAALATHPSFGDRREGAWREELAVGDDPARAALEGAVFEALAQQVTAFICNLDEATVNVGAAEPHTIHLSSSSGARRGGTGGAGAGGGASSGGASSASGSASSCPPGASTAGLFRRLRAVSHRASGFGWREARAAFERAMRDENRAERLVARSDPAAAEKRLHQRLLVARLEAVAFKGCTGGNSLFDAVSLAAWGSAAFGPTLRALAVAYAAAHPREYRCFLGDDWEAYLSGMARPGVPGDELMLRALADHFGLPINIATSDAFMWFQRYAPVRTTTQREVTLAFLGPCTWMPVRRPSAIAALRLSLSGISEWRQARELRRKMLAPDPHAGPPGTP